MPVHDWTRVRAGTFHFFHQRWISAICDGFNTDGLPRGYFAMSEQVARGPVPDVLTLRAERGSKKDDRGVGLVAARPMTRFSSRAAETEVYASRADRVTIHLDDGELVAVIEIVSPGNKSSKNALHAFVERAVGLLDRGIHLLVVDLFPPTKRDPAGIHKAIWDEVTEEPLELPADKPLVLASYSAGPPVEAFVEPIATGDSLPEMALFLEPGRHIPAPLEATYQATWAVFPDPPKVHFEPPVG